MTELHVTDSVKMIRETLALAQSRIGNSVYDQGRKVEHIQRLQRLINECDRHRPLGINGKHGNLHTDTCGCPDKGPREHWGKVTPLVHWVDFGSLTPVCNRAMIPEQLAVASNYHEVTCPDCNAWLMRNR